MHATLYAPVQCDFPPIRVHLHGIHLRSIVQDHICVKYNLLCISLQEDLQRHSILYKKDARIGDQHPCFKGIVELVNLFPFELVWVEGPMIFWSTDLYEMVPFQHFSILWNQ